MIKRNLYNLTMIKINWKQFIDEHRMKKPVINFMYTRTWFGWWFASYCSAHQKHNMDCDLCSAGSWARSKHGRWIITKPKFGYGPGL